jgi:hypothetical protein
MGRLAGFKYREVVKRLKRLGFQFDRQAAGSHEIWFNPRQTFQREPCAPFLTKAVFGRASSWRFKTFR